LKWVSVKLFLTVTSTPMQVANWQAFHMRGEAPAPRKGAAAAASGARVVMFGGSVVDAAAESQAVTDELVVLDMGEH
jgi:hypothetical protein